MKPGAVYCRRRRSAGGLGGCEGEGTGRRHRQGRRVAADLRPRPQLTQHRRHRHPPPHRGCPCPRHRPWPATSGTWLLSTTSSAGESGRWTWMGQGSGHTNGVVRYTAIAVPRRLSVALERWALPAVGRSTCHPSGQQTLRCVPGFLVAAGFRVRLGLARQEAPDLVVSLRLGVFVSSDSVGVVDDADNLPVPSGLSVN